MPTITYPQVEWTAQEIARRGQGSAEHRFIGDGSRRLAYGSRDALVYRVIASHLDRKTGECWPCAATIGLRVRCSKAMAMDAARRLAANGYLTIHQRVLHTPKGVRWFQAYELHYPARVLTVAQKLAILDHRAPRLLRAETRERLTAEAHERLAARTAALMGTSAAAASIRMDFGRKNEVVDQPHPANRAAGERPQPTRYLPFEHRSAPPRRPGLHVTGRITVRQGAQMSPDQQIATLLRPLERRIE